MILALQSRLASSIRTAVRTLFDADLPAVAFQYPPRIELGDLALTAPFDLAKTLRRKPREIAEALAAELEDVEGSSCTVGPSPGRSTRPSMTPSPPPSYRAR